MPFDVAVRRPGRWTFLRDERGTSVVEFALVVPILFLIVFGIVDFSRAFYTMSSLTAAVREGARLAATMDHPCSPGNPEKVKALVAQRFRPLASPALSESLVRIYVFGDPGGPCDPPPPDVKDDREEVTVEVDAYPFNPITPIIRDTIPMSPRVVFRREGV
jgi:hypothetical protein